MAPGDGANNLHQALYMARRIPEPDLPPRRASSYLQLRQDMLRLVAPGGLWINVEAFLAIYSPVQLANVSLQVG